MADVKHFDPDAVLERATHVFWRRGFEATSVQDLVDELGISKSSLYASFGSKDQLYQQALLHYCKVEAGPRHALLTGDGSVLAAVRALLSGIARAPLEHPDRRGCLVVNAAMERVPADPDTTAAVTAQLERFEGALFAALRRGQETGEIDSKQDARSLARFLVCVVQGMRVVGKATGSTEALLDTVEVSLRTIGPRPSPRA